MRKEKKNPVLRVRNQSKTERGRISTMVIPDKKKAENKKRCRGKSGQRN